MAPCKLCRCAMNVFQCIKLIFKNNVIVGVELGVDIQQAQHQSTSNRTTNTGMGSLRLPTSRPGRRRHYNRGICWSRKMCTKLKYFLEVTSLRIKIVDGTFPGDYPFAPEYRMHCNDINSHRYSRSIIINARSSNSIHDRTNPLNRTTASRNSATTIHDHEYSRTLNVPIKNSHGRNSSASQLSSMINGATNCPSGNSNDLTTNSLNPALRNRTRGRLGRTSDSSTTMNITRSESPSHNSQDEAGSSTPGSNQSYLLSLTTGMSPGDVLSPALAIIAKGWQHIRDSTAARLPVIPEEDSSDLSSPPEYSETLIPKSNSLINRKISDAREESPNTTSGLKNDTIIKTDRPTRHLNQNSLPIVISILPVNHSSPLRLEHTKGSACSPSNASPSSSSGTQDESSSSSNYVSLRPSEQPEDAELQHPSNCMSGQNRHWCDPSFAVVYCCLAILAILLNYSVSINEDKHHQ